MRQEAGLESDKWERMFEDYQASAMLRVVESLKHDGVPEDIARLEAEVFAKIGQVESKLSLKPSPMYKAIWWKYQMATPSFELTGIPRSGTPIERIIETPGIPTPESSSSDGTLTEADVESRIDAAFSYFDDLTFGQAETVASTTVLLQDTSAEGVHAEAAAERISDCEYPEDAIVSIDATSKIQGVCNTVKSEIADVFTRTRAFTEGLKNADHLLSRVQDAIANGLDDLINFAERKTMALLDKIIDLLDLDTHRYNAFVKLNLHHLETGTAAHQTSQNKLNVVQEVDVQATVQAWLFKTSNSDADRQCLLDVTVSQKAPFPAAITLDLTTEGGEGTATATGTFSIKDKNQAVNFEIENPRIIFNPIEHLNSVIEDTVSAIDAVADKMVSAGEWLGNVSDWLERTMKSVGSRLRTLSARVANLKDFPIYMAKQFAMEYIRNDLEELVSTMLSEQANTAAEGLPSAVGDFLAKPYEAGDEFRTELHFLVNEPMLARGFIGQIIDDVVNPVLMSPSKLQTLREDFLVKQRTQGRLLSLEACARHRCAADNNGDSGETSLTCNQANLINYMALGKLVDRKRNGDGSGRTCWEGRVLPEVIIASPVLSEAASSKSDSADFGEFCCRVDADHVGSLSVTSFDGYCTPSMCSGEDVHAVEDFVVTTSDSLYQKMRVAPILWHDRMYTPRTGEEHSTNAFDKIESLDWETTTTAAEDAATPAEPETDTAAENVPRPRARPDNLAPLENVPRPRARPDNLPGHRCRAIGGTCAARSACASSGDSLRKLKFGLCPGETFCCIGCETSSGSCVHPSSCSNGHIERRLCAGRDPVCCIRDEPIQSRFEELADDTQLLDMLLQETTSEEPNEVSFDWSSNWDGSESFSVRNGTMQVADTIAFWLLDHTDNGSFQGALGTAFLNDIKIADKKAGETCPDGYTMLLESYLWAESANLRRDFVDVADEANHEQLFLCLQYMTQRRITATAVVDVSMTLKGQEAPEGFELITQTVGGKDASFRPCVGCPELVVVISRMSNHPGLPTLLTEEDAAAVLAEHRNDVENRLMTPHDGALSSQPDLLIEQLIASEAISEQRAARGRSEEYTMGYGIVIEPPTPSEFEEIGFKIIFQNIVPLSYLTARNFSIAYKENIERPIEGGTGTFQGFEIAIDLSVAAETEIVVQGTKMFGSLTLAELAALLVPSKNSVKAERLPGVPRNSVLFSTDGPAQIDIRCKAKLSVTYDPASSGWTMHVIEMEWPHLDLRLEVEQEPIRWLLDVAMPPDSTEIVAELLDFHGMQLEIAKGGLSATIGEALASVRGKNAQLSFDGSLHLPKRIQYPRAIFGILRRFLLKNGIQVTQ